jgi:hypothetical protein
MTRLITNDPEVNLMFMDSGAHSLYNAKARGARPSQKYAFFDTDEFWAYVDEYAEFIKKNQKYIDHYVNVDVIHNPELSWRNQKYLEDEHGLKPVPVVHHETPMSWLMKYLDAGYDYIGLGGVAQHSTRQSYIAWADQVYEILCDNPTRTPMVKTHGFAMTAYQTLTRYPWFSVDSASWAKAGGFGMVMFPRLEGGEFTFSKPPFNMCFSSDSPQTSKQGRHYFTCTQKERDILKLWLQVIDIPLGNPNVEKEDPEWMGVITHHTMRKAANIRFFRKLVESLPEWPWPINFKSTAIRRGKGFNLI